MTVATSFDSVLLAGIRRRDPDVINSLRCRVMPAMVHFIERRGFDTTQAQWLAQDVFVDFVYRWVERIDEPRAIERYLRAMCLTAIRRVARRSDRQVSIAEHVGSDDGSTARIHDALDAARLGPCIDELTPRLRERLQQHYHQGQSMAAVARREGVSAPAVRKSILKALAALRRCLGVNP